MNKILMTLLFLVLSTAEAYVEKTEKLQAADHLLAQNNEIEIKYVFSFRGKTFIGYPNVYSPVIFPGASKQADLPIKEGDRFLEIGCGTGIFAVQAALQGAASVVAIDINPDAVANTIENAKMHSVEDRVRVLEGDLFAPLKEDERFDIIFFNIPFCHRNANAEELTMLAKSLFDPEHDILYRFLKEGRAHLAEGGRMILGYSTTHGDIDLMHSWAKEFGWKTTLLHKMGDERVDFITVEMYEFQ